MPPATTNRSRTGFLDNLASNNTKYLERQKGEAMEGEVAAWTEPQNDGMNESSNANDVEPNSASGAVAFRGAVGD